MKEYVKILTFEDTSYVHCVYSINEWYGKNLGCGYEIFQVVEESDYYMNGKNRYTVLLRLINNEQ